MHESHLPKKILILAASVLASIAVYVLFSWSIPSGYLRDTKIEEWYGFISIIFLFFTLLAGPLYQTFPQVRGKTTYRGLLGGLGIAAFYFALLHSYVSFFSLLYGFNGLAFLPQADLLSVLFGFVALAILALLAGTSFTFAMKKMGRRWKVLHRFVYFAALSALVHIALVGNHYENTASVSYLATLTGITVLLVLQGITFQRRLVMRFPQISAYVWTTAMLLVGVLIGYGLELLHRFGHHHV